MARSVSLSAYLALARRPAPSDWAPPREPRPAGSIVWVHAASQGAMAGLLQLAIRLERDHPGAHVLLTRGGDAERPARVPGNVVQADLPPENIPAAEAFLDHWRPNLALWSNGHLRPALLTCAGKRDFHLILVDAEETALEEARWRWLPDMSRGVIDQFHLAFARTANAARRLTRLGMAPERIDITGPLQQAGQALNCNEEERAEVAATIAGRPVWLAAMVKPGELDLVLRAHRLASRSTHRLFLVLVPDDEAQGPDYARAAREAGFRVAIWSEGEVPGEATQILLADTRGDMGLWYRLSPIAFMASSLFPEHGGSDPYEPAALGSAVLSGPETGRYAAAYTRLAEGGAARIVRDAETLAAAVSRLTAPDQAAAMAHAAWMLATEGAEATDRLLTLMGRALDGEVI
ncbi:3-deoxy-D-manno-octulosonic acid transferase [Pseudooceanicola sp.]|uniref:3-deoxy-D-manno-octulosonic acid transferase n=1 Tax=Pseudooceanicola sp. TaxID=1914328 RepID=UPI003519B642